MQRGTLFNQVISGLIPSWFQTTQPISRENTGSPSGSEDGFVIVASDSEAEEKKKEGRQGADLSLRQAAAAAAPQEVQLTIENESMPDETKREAHSARAVAPQLTTLTVQQGNLSFTSEMQHAREPLLSGNRVPAPIARPLPPSALYPSTSDLSFCVGVLAGTFGSSLEKLPLFFQEPISVGLSVLGAKYTFLVLQRNNANSNQEQIQKDLFFNAIGAGVATNTLQYFLAPTLGFWAVPLTLASAKILATRVQPFAECMASWWRERKRDPQERVDKKFDGSAPLPRPGH